ncbi:DNA cytosine methyltransferase [Pseudacidovorax sp. NFM-22]|uniref:DNA cytosine methyltransferase n=1 Tax=Pseudacidovorax sp. NFM-22 TaxID=2744469 RepID=UPI001F43BF83|nr:DNA cytosine methyltransferase [Pseudacidovorax sp. NFM-22]
MLMPTTIEIRHGHLFCGLGGGAKGFNAARPVLGSQRARFRCVGGIDNDPAAIADFSRAAGVAGTVLDMFDRSQYTAFHGAEPPATWREATPADIHSAFHHERPHIVFLSAPCKGFSGLLSEGKSKTEKYQALNRLTLRGIWLLLEAYKDDPVEMLLFENVPRIATRGRHLLDQIGDLLRAYGYAVAETTHDCGELAGLAQSRKRFLLVARHIAKVPPFLYEPAKQQLRAVGDVLGRMPLPGDLRAGPMHRVPSLQWKTWVRLAFVEAGSDWRSLNRLAVEDGVLSDFLIVPDMHGGALGVRDWAEPTGVVAGANRPHNGAFSVADPRHQLYGAGCGVTDWTGTSGAIAGESLPSNGRFAVADPRAEASAAQYQQYGVMRMDQTAGAVIGVKSPGQGTFSVADPRHGGPAKFSNEFRIVARDRAGNTVTGAHGSAQAVADPRGPQERLFGKYHCADWTAAGRTVIGGSTSGEGSYAVADPRPGIQRSAGDAYLTGGHYGVVAWDGQSGAVSASAGHDNGRWSVADPRPMPAPADKLVCRIRSLDGTWHRPFTTLELAALQSLVDPEEQLELDGLSDQAWRERIGNAVPPKAAQAVAEEMGRTLMLAWSGETFALGSTPIWVRNVAVAVSASPGDRA